MVDLFAYEKPIRKLLDIGIDVDVIAKTLNVNEDKLTNHIENELRIKIKTKKIEDKPPLEPKSKKKPENIKSAANDGLTAVEIADKTNYSLYSVYSYAKKLGINEKLKQNTKNKRLRDSQESEGREFLEQLIQYGKSKQWMGEQLKVSITTAKKWLIKYELYDKWEDNVKEKKRLESTLASLVRKIFDKRLESASLPEKKAFGYTSKYRIRSDVLSIESLVRLFDAYYNAELGEGTNYSLLGEDAGIKDLTVKRILDRSGLKISKRSIQRKKIYAKPLRNFNLELLFKQGRNAYEIKKKLGFTPGFVKNYAIAHGLWDKWVTDQKKSELLKKKQSKIKAGIKRRWSAKKIEEKFGIDSTFVAYQANKLGLGEKLKENELKEKREEQKNYELKRGLEFFIANVYSLTNLGKGLNLHPATVRNLLIKYELNERRLDIIQKKSESAASVLDILFEDQGEASATKKRAADYISKTIVRSDGLSLNSFTKLLKAYVKAEKDGIVTNYKELGDVIDASEQKTGKILGSMGLKLTNIKRDRKIERNPKLEFLFKEGYNPNEIKRKLGIFPTTSKHYAEFYNLNKEWEEKKIKRLELKKRISKVRVSIKKGAKTAKIASKLEESEEFVVSVAKELDLYEKLQENEARVSAIKIEKNPKLDILINLGKNANEIKKELRIYPYATNNYVNHFGLRETWEEKKEKSKYMKKISSKVKTRINIGWNARRIAEYLGKPEEFVGSVADDIGLDKKLLENKNILTPKEQKREDRLNKIDSMLKEVYSIFTMARKVGSNYITVKKDMIISGQYNKWVEYRNQKVEDITSIIDRISEQNPDQALDIKEKTNEYISSSMERAGRPSLELVTNLLRVYEASIIPKEGTNYKEIGKAVGLSAVNTKKILSTLGLELPKIKRGGRKKIEVKEPKVERKEYRGTDNLGLTDEEEKMLEFKLDRSLTIGEVAARDYGDGVSEKERDKIIDRCLEEGLLPYEIAMVKGRWNYNSKGIQEYARKTNQEKRWVECIEKRIMKGIYEINLRVEQGCYLEELEEKTGFGQKFLKKYIELKGLQETWDGAIEKRESTPKRIPEIDECIRRGCTYDEINGITLIKKNKIIDYINKTNQGKFLEELQLLRKRHPNQTRTVEAGGIEFETTLGVDKDFKNNISELQKMEKDPMGNPDPIYYGIHFLLSYNQGKSYSSLMNGI